MALRELPRKLRDIHLDPAVGDITSEPTDQILRILLGVKQPFVDYTQPDSLLERVPKA